MARGITRERVKKYDEQDLVIHSAIDLHQIIIAEIGLLKSMPKEQRYDKDTLTRIEKDLVRSAELLQGLRSSNAWKKMAKTD